MRCTFKRKTTANDIKMIGLLLQSEWSETVKESLDRSRIEAMMKQQEKVSANVWLQQG